MVSKSLTILKGQKFRKRTIFVQYAKIVHFLLSYRQKCSPLTLINSATMLTAISSGVSELMSSPMGA